MKETIEKKATTITKDDVINICKTGAVLGVGAIILVSGWRIGYNMGQVKLWDAMTVWNRDQAVAFNDFVAAVNICSKT